MRIGDISKGNVFIFVSWLGRTVMVYHQVVFEEFIIVEQVVGVVSVASTTTTSEILRRLIVEVVIEVAFP
jgi:hypothetical protein